MEKEQTIPVSARIQMTLFSEIQLELKETKKSMNDWLNNAIKNELYSNSNLELLDSEIQFHEAIINNLKQKKEDHNKKELTFLKIPENETPFLLESKKVLERDPTFINGRISLYKNKFGKNYRISPDEFYKLIYQAESQSQEKEILGEAIQ